LNVRFGSQGVTYRIASIAVARFSGCIAQKQTLALALLARGFIASIGSNVAEFDCARLEAVAEVLAEMAASPPPDPQPIVDRVSKPARAKFDGLLPNGLMHLVTAVERLDVVSVPEVAARLVGSRN